MAMPNDDGYDWVSSDSESYDEDLWEDPGWELGDEAWHNINM